MNKQLEGKVAVITGGAQGVGFGIAQEFIENGASVVLTGRRRGALDEAVARLGSKSSGVVADVSKLSDMEVQVYRHGKRENTFYSNGTTAFEVVSRNKNPYVPLIF